MRKLAEMEADMRRVVSVLALALAGILVAAPAEAASTAAPVTPGYLTTTPQPNCPSGPCFVPFSPTNPQPVTPSGGAGNVTQTAVSVATTSTPLLAAAAASLFVRICVPASAANAIWVRWDGGAPAQAAPSDNIQPGVCAVWVKASGYLPQQQINALASATTSVVVIYQ